MSGMRILVSEPTVHSENVAVPFATYKVETTEDDRTWIRLTRWSEVRWLHGQMPPCESGPAFHPHSFRLGAAHTSPELLAERCGELQALLRAWTREFHVSLIECRGPAVLRDFLAGEQFDQLHHWMRDSDSMSSYDGPASFGAAQYSSHHGPRSVSDPSRSSRARSRTIDQATPPEYWYTLPNGWPDLALQMTRELSLPDPDRGCAPAVDRTKGIGTLSIEVLEASGLKPVGTTLSENNVHALILFEGHAVRTSTRWDENDPVWPPGCARAARLPITAPYSELYVALLHEQTRPFSAIETDSAVPIGRVWLRLSRLHPNSVHDVWLPLQMETCTHTTRLGLVRLRVSVTWSSMWQALSRYVQPTPATFDHVFQRACDLKAAQFAAFGPPSCVFDAHTALRAPIFAEWDERFSMEVLIDHKNELNAEADAFVAWMWECLEHLLMWRSPLSTLCTAVFWQLIAARPDLLPASAPLMLLVYLCRTHTAVFGTGILPVSHPPPIRQLIMSSLGMGGGTNYSPALQAASDQCLHCGTYRSATGWRCSCLSRVARGRTLEEAVTEVLTATKHASGRKFSANDLATLGVRHTHQRSETVQLHGMKSMQCSAAHNTLPGHAVCAEHARHSAVRAAQVAKARALDLDETQLDPLASELGLVQQRLCTILVYMRSLKRLLHWEDSAMTLWLAVLCAAASAFLVVLPTLVSWQTQFQLLGLLLFGPHMMFWGVRRRMAEHQADALERRYQSAEPSAAKAMVDALVAERTIMANEARRKADLRSRSASLAKSAAEREHERMRRRQIDSAAFHLKLSAPRWCAERFPLRADPQLSQIWPLDVDASR